MCFIQIFIQISGFSGFAAAITGATGAAAGTFRSIRAANALDPLFPCFPQIQKRGAEDHGNNNKNQIIDRIHHDYFPFRAYSFFTF